MPSNPRTHQRTSREMEIRAQALSAQTPSPSKKTEASSSRQFEAKPSEPKTLQRTSTDMATHARVLLPFQENEEYFAKWDKWATKSDQASDEKRGEAADRMKAWLTAADPKQPLDLSNLNLTKLPKNLSTLTSLRQLNVSQNKLESLPILVNLSSLVSLNVSNNQLPKLRTLPNSLTHLNASNNNITEVTNLPSKLAHLNVSNNQLPKLRTLPKSLTHLLASNNNITEVPNLPPDIVTINLSNNKSLRFISLPQRFRDCVRQASFAQYPRLKSLSLNDQPFQGEVFPMINPILSS